MWLPNFSSSFVAYFERQPALKALLAIIAGIAFSLAVLTSQMLVVVASVVFFAVFVSVFVYEDRKKALVLPLWAIAGLWIGYAAFLEKPPEIPRSLSARSAFVEGSVLKILDRSPTRLRCLIRGSADLKELPRLRNRTMMLTMYMGDTLSGANFHIEEGAKIRGRAKVRFPRRAELPTDIDEAMFALSRDVYMFATMYSADIAVFGQEKLPWTAVFTTMGEQLKDNLLELMPQESAGIAVGIVTGDKRFIPASVREAFSLTGTAHVLAVSGLHVGIVAVALLVPLAGLRQNWLRFLIFCAGIITFALMTGAAPSTLRAGTMAILMFGMSLLQRKVALLNILAATIIIILLVQPTLLYSIGFQMSVGALLGIGITLPPLQRLTQKSPLLTRNSFAKGVVASIAVTMAASVFTTPLTAAYFGMFSLISPFANILVIPLMSAAMVYSLCAGLMAFVWTVPAELFAATAHGCILLATYITSYLAEVPLAAYSGGDVLTVACIASAVFLYVIFGKGWKRIFFRAGIAGVAVGIVAILSPSEEGRAGRELFEREGFSVEIVPLAAPANQALVYLRDTDTSYRSVTDFSLKKYLRENFDSLIIIADGFHALHNAAAFSSEADVVVVPTLAKKRSSFFRAIDTLHTKKATLVNAEKALDNEDVATTFFPHRKKSK